MRNPPVLPEIKITLVRTITETYTVRGKEGRPAVNTLDADELGAMCCSLLRAGVSVGQVGTRQSIGGVVVDPDVKDPPWDITTTGGFGGQEVRKASYEVVRAFKPSAEPEDPR